MLSPLIPFISPSSAVLVVPFISAAVVHFDSIHRSNPSTATKEVKQDSIGGYARCWTLRWLWDRELQAYGVPLPYALWPTSIWAQRPRTSALPTQQRPPSQGLRS